MVSWQPLHCLLPWEVGLVGGMNALGGWGWQRAEPGFSLRSTLCSHLPRCLLRMHPWRGAPCSPCFLFWLSSPCSDLDSRPWTTVPPCLGYWASLGAYCPTEKGTGLSAKLAHCSCSTALFRSGHFLSCSKEYICTDL